MCVALVAAVSSELTHLTAVVTDRLFNVKEPVQLCMPFSRRLSPGLVLIAAVACWQEVFGGGDGLAKLVSQILVNYRTSFFFDPHIKKETPPEIWNPAAADTNSYKAMCAVMRAPLSRELAKAWTRWAGRQTALEPQIRAWRHLCLPFADLKLPPGSQDNLYDECAEKQRSGKLCWLACPFWPLTALRLLRARERQRRQAGPAGPFRLADQHLRVWICRRSMLQLHFSPDQDEASLSCAVLYRPLTKSGSFWRVVMRSRLSELGGLESSFREAVVASVTLFEELGSHLQTIGEQCALAVALLSGSDPPQTELASCQEKMMTAVCLIVARLFAAGQKAHQVRSSLHLGRPG